MTNDPDVFLIVPNGSTTVPNDTVIVVSNDDKVI